MVEQAAGVVLCSFVLLGVSQVAQVYKTRLPDGMASCTDGVDIWIDDRLNEVQEKCAVAHEEVHVERGHTSRQSEAVELSVRYETAYRLLPDIQGCSGNTLAAAARNLGVTRQVLMDRAATFTDAQAVSAGCMDCLLCPVIQARYARHPSTHRIAA